MNETTEEQALPEPEITRASIFSLQVCVPGSFTDEEVEIFANDAAPTGISSGWSIRKEGDPDLKGDLERAPCNERQGCVHIVLDC